MSESIMTIKVKSSKSNEEIAEIFMEVFLTARRLGMQLEIVSLKEVKNDKTG